MEVDLVVCGGGLAGLSAALMAGRMGFSVALVEKKTYPFHKVCGEYLSLESRSLIGHLGIPTKNLPLIDTFFCRTHLQVHFQVHFPLVAWELAGIFWIQNYAGWSGRKVVWF
jgi:2-polyprenyl-6-methoxyphenol hydroxylase-like FAD-dependent oxidoreductase